MQDSSKHQHLSLSWAEGSIPSKEIGGTSFLPPRFPLHHNIARLLSESGASLSRHDTPYSMAGSGGYLSWCEGLALMQTQGEPVGSEGCTGHGFPLGFLPLHVR